MSRSLTSATPRTSFLELRLLATAIGIACMPLFAAIASAQSTPEAKGSTLITAPAEIDRAVAAFTGAEIGEIGGARRPADARLRLAACAAPLDVAWHGRNRSTVRVECAGPQGWRIFIATRAVPQVQVAQQNVVSRGDPITVMVRGSGFTVQQSGEAMDSGAIGDWIAVRTEPRAEPIRARIERPGLAIIPVS